MVKRFLLAFLIGSLLSSGVALAAGAVPRLAPEVEAQTVALEFPDRTVGEVFEAIGETTALLGVIAPVPGSLLFVKLKGPVADVKAQKAAFLELCKSLRTNG